MVLEDDAVFVEDFVEKFNRYYRQMPDDWDMCFVGSCCGLRTNNMKKDVFVYPANSSRCTHCYMLSKAGLNKIKDKMKSINNAIDWYYNHLINSIPLNNYWMDPSLSYQSEEFKTSLGSWK
jgi:GR25 family glycosyltransferase involved in LPS biosynthesis